MDMFLYRLCEVLLPNIVASWLSSGRLLIISVTVLCKDIYTVLKLKRAVLHPEKTQNRNQSSKHELRDDDNGCTVVVDHCFSLFLNKLNAHFLLLPFFYF